MTAAAPRAERPERASQIPDSVLELAWNLYALSTHEDHKAAMREMAEAILEWRDGEPPPLEGQLWNTDDWQVGRSDRLWLHIDGRWMVGRKVGFAVVVNGGAAEGIPVSEFDGWTVLPLLHEGAGP